MKKKKNPRGRGKSGQINNSDDDIPPGKILICRQWITLRNGRKLHASQIGKKAICFLVDA